MGDAEEGREPGSIGALPDAGAAKEDPLHVPALAVPTATQGVEVQGGG